MGPYGIQEGFWNEFFPFIVAAAFLLIGIPAILRYRMGADKKKWFLNEHINEFHKKGDWIIRANFFFFLITASIIFYPHSSVTLIVSMLFAIIQIGFTTYVEWKFAANRQNFKVSFAEMILFFVTFIGVMIWLE
ncbi:DUF4181 domain-containing protein [Halobacillus sp. Marseille-P3879]|uniref:DUF4181 domain-containing protein n=1 Tax=Halobacillus sp. Marseille-P3879 TaxID=2045014 RepID=UPI000C79F2A7|nr:DUF4181 domain-containing protein [Halobacillus sp. Marseille-P3879]